MRIFILALLLPAVGDEGLAPWAANKHASDAPKQHREEVTKSQQTYTVVQGGTMDGRNCRSPLGCGMSREGAIVQTWESNRSVRMENVGDADVQNPWLSNGHNNLRTVDEIIAAATSPGMTDAENCMGLWFYRIQHRYHFGTDSREEGDLVKTFNIYGYNTCGSDSMMMAGLWKTIGLKGAPARGVGHCISQVFYDGKWHLYDGDLKAVYLNRDNETVAGEQDIVRDHDLIKRTHTQGILLPDARSTQEGTAAIYGFEGEVVGQRDCYREGSMKMTLRPGEALVWRWGRTTPAKYHGDPRNLLYPETICNGLWEYRPDFSKETWRKGAVVEGVKSSPAGLSDGAITWTMKSPYVMVGGKLVAEGQGAEFSVSFDGKSWQPVGADFDKAFAWTNNSPAKYGYQLRCTLAGGATLRSLAIVNNLQMAPMVLPEMSVGKNEFVYTDESPGRKIRITHDWVERSASQPPAAPPGAIAPADGGESDGTDAVFQWKVPTDPDGDKIADYQFELSNRQDLRWPLSMTFYRLISRTADKGKAQFTVGAPGLLTADRKYYWHVRAKDEKGVWGPWSATWSFTARGPNPPVDLTLDSGTLLRWKPNGAGRKPAAYRIYGSDEKGFSVSDAPYPVSVGNCKELTNPFPANFLAETKSPEFQILSQPARAYYRVVAVDDKGKRSGPSDFVVAPRPVIYSKPVATAKVGAPYTYAVQASRSLGDLRCRQVNGRDSANFWDIEKLRVALEKGPEWLKADGAILGGTPTSAGSFEVELTLTLERDVRKLDGGVLSWGNEKVVSQGVEKVGAAAQKFTIVVEN
jgi:hypothetical protein